MIPPPSPHDIFLSEFVPWFRKSVCCWEYVKRILNSLCSVSYCEYALCSSPGFVFQFGLQRVFTQPNHVSFQIPALQDFVFVLTLLSLVVSIYTTRFNTLKLCILPTQCICVFRMVLTMNSDCFLKQHFPVGLCSGDVMCFLWNTNWNYIYYLEEIPSLTD
jgi:hypothetical protein